MPKAKEKPPAPCANCSTARRGGVIRVRDDGKTCAACGEPAPAAPSYPLFDDLGPGTPTFEGYFDKHVEAIKSVQRMLSFALNDDPALMEKQVRQVESYLGRMKSVLGWADAYLDIAEHAALGALPPRSSDYTDTDRTKAVAAAVVRQRRFRDVVRGIIESIETRISYGQSRLRFIERNNG